MIPIRLPNSGLWLPPEWDDGPAYTVGVTQWTRWTLLVSHRTWVNRMRVWRASGKVGPRPDNLARVKNQLSHRHVDPITGGIRGWRG